MHPQRVAASRGSEPSAAWRDAHKHIRLRVIAAEIFPKLYASAQRAVRVGQPGRASELHARGTPGPEAPAREQPAPEETPRAADKIACRRFRHCRARRLAPE